MGSTCAGVTQYSTPRSRFVKPYMEAPCQVIGFDLSPKGGNSAVVPDTGDSKSRVHPSAAVHSTCTNSYSIDSKTATDPRRNSSSSTSPRSALQQLLLRPFSQSESPRSSPPANPINLTHGLLLAPAPCIKSQAAKQSLRSGALTPMQKPYAVEVECQIPIISAANSNWASFKGIPESITPSHHATTITEWEYDSSSALGSAHVGEGKKTCHMEKPIHELTWRSQRYSEDHSSRNLEDRLYELPPFKDKSKKRIWMEAATIDTEHSNSSGIFEMSWKQASMNLMEKSKKSNLFVLAASSPTAECSKHYHLHGADENSSRNMDMEFLNSCYLCKRLLAPGHDVFMYSGDKAFCSMECRYQQIVTDERKERHAPPVIRSGASPIYQGYMVSAGAAVRTTVATATTHHIPITINRPNFINPAAVA